MQANSSLFLFYRIPVAPEKKEAQVLKRKQSFLLIVVLVVSMFALAGCIGDEPLTIYEDADFVQVEWIEINPPPGQNGPCYAFFSNDAAGYAGFGFAGVSCP